LHPVGKLGRREHKLAHGGGLVFRPGAWSLALVHLLAERAMIVAQGRVAAAIRTWSLTAGRSGVAAADWRAAAAVTGRAGWRKSGNVGIVGIVFCDGGDGVFAAPGVPQDVGVPGHREEIIHTSMVQDGIMYLYLFR
jgi:hypothetical protein